MILKNEEGRKRIYLRYDNHRRPMLISKNRNVLAM